MLLLMPGIISTSRTGSLRCWCDSYAQGTFLVVKQRGIFANGKIEFSPNLFSASPRANPPPSPSPSYTGYNS